MFFCVWLIFLSIMSSRFLHVVACMGVCSLFTAECGSTVCADPCAVSASAAVTFLLREHSRTSARVDASCVLPAVPGAGVLGPGTIQFPFPVSPFCKMWARPPGVQRPRRGACPAGYGVRSGGGPRLCFPAERLQEGHRVAHLCVVSVGLHALHLWIHKCSWTLAFTNPA